MISFLDDDFNQLNHFIKKKKPSKIFFLVDENTHECCLPLILPNLEIEIPFEIIEIDAGEDMKSIETASQLWEILSDFEADRKSLLINVGGGVITDLGGFVASTYKRGIPFIHLPTSLLAMCDASIGGKTGIDLKYLKNMVGTFSLPKHIFLYPIFLKTLPFEELRSGFAEMLKHGLIIDAKHWEELISIKELSVESISGYIEKSMDIKQKIVEVDFHEKNVRKMLNFGHTFGHAIESLYLKNGKNIRHGEAIAMGILLESHLSMAHHQLSNEAFEQIKTSILQFFPYLPIKESDKKELIDLMKNDKKNQSREINFSLLPEIGKCKIDCNEAISDILSSLNFYEKIS